MTTAADLPWKWHEGASDPPREHPAIAPLGVEAVPVPRPGPPSVSYPQGTR